MAQATSEPGTAPRYATKRAAATYAAVSNRTVERWIASGLITRYATSGDHVRIDLNEVDRLLAGAVEGDPADVLEEYVRRLVDDAPPLSDAQRVRLASLMRSGAAAVEAVTS